MQMPFTTEQFLNVFRLYNGSFPFMPIVTYAAGIGTLLFAGRDGQRTDRAILSMLGFFWVWNGVAYHIGFFRAINPAAVIFGGLFVLQGVLLLIAAARGRTMRITLGLTPKARLGSVFVLYAMVIYPILGHLLGHGYPASPVFGMAPCPTTIFTIGVLLLARGNVPVYLLVVPLLWSIVGFGAAVNLRIYEDFGLTVAGLLGTTVILISNYRSKKNRDTKEKKNETESHSTDPHGDSVDVLARRGLGGIKSRPSADHRARHGGHWRFHLSRGPARRSTAASVSLIGLRPEYDSAL